MLFKNLDTTKQDGVKLKAFNEKLFTLYGFGAVFLVIGIIIFIFGAQRTSSGSWDWQWFSTHNYVLNGPGLALIVFGFIGALFLFFGSRLEKKTLQVPVNF
jgi:hypothetical protein